MSVLKLINVKKDYFLGKTKVNALKEINLEINKGEFLAIVGPSGSGKTTLFNIIGCIDKPTSGKVIVSENDIVSLPKDKLADLRLHKIGFIFQTFNLIPVLDVLENVEFPLLVSNMYKKKEIKEKALNIIEQVKMQNHIKHRPSELSGGQRQRVAIARALVSNPEIVLADEPTANIDHETGNVIMNLMRELNEKLNTTFLFSTHDPEVIKYSKKTIKLRDGLIEE